MKLIDTHAHIDVAAFDADRNTVLEQCLHAGVSHIVVPGIIANTWDKLRETCASSPALYASFGLHPVYLEQHDPDDIDTLTAYVKRYRPIAVGEIGLDFYCPTLNQNRQRTLFEAQLAVATNATLPVLLHVRKSHDAVLACLRKTTVTGGICHAFNGSLQQAHQYIDLGFKLGFGGMLSFERSHKLHRLAQQLPLEAIVLETDAPDMAGAGHHGQRNSPEYLPEYLQALAKLRPEDIRKIAAQTTANAEAVLDFSRTNT
ncbi:Putative deoxyribonuclease YjjV [hydrothermal vent metagenome]|uniref:Deoxyribonuclease YjjV n=1 Tax=hydrothermal vent metagenome TaxID=652676 RepID=A0A3B1ADR0_9ZZZZ